MPIKMTVYEAEGITPIPADVYPAILSGISEGEGNYGPYFRLEFEVADEEFSGEKRSTITSDKLTRGPKGSSKLLGILEALEGRKLELDEEVDLEDFVGKECRIVVDEAEEKDGVTIQNVSNVMPSKK